MKAQKLEEMKENGELKDVAVLEDVESKPGINDIRQMPMLQKKETPDKDEKGYM